MNTASNRTRRPNPAGAPQRKMFRVLSPYAFVHQGETRHAWSDVGIAFESHDGQGVNIEIRPNLSVSGRLVLRPFNRTAADAAAGDATSSADGAPARFVYDVTSPAEELV